MSNRMVGALAISLLIIAVGTLWYFSSPRAASGDYSALALCIRDRGVVMYGADWCPHCKNEKARFGAAAEFVPYVECTTNAELCKAKGVERFPTWILPDGRHIEGDLPLEKLAAETGCPIK
jgi:thiol-disulfide isomerase/thioredoxin